ncbi:16S rRNA (guanine(966)-N(2))-methyltransferase RsmD [Helicobacter sp. MIT 05-5294]|uniref:16S rRNA (guanine(966)-N(2))-methyltransferase RsmD n=1 Tax=Helicobacter sp. MIT 05-5294 TaxID=1548150 RepID=UPI0010FF2AAC|nr:16S rRNA (guanine(966)-N(2))-methyltransferase RsmD [Helicobacter sp. MIT 05-5294]TLD89146.1 16S rRNA (guanine(966)-N(2))-methyltransferase RsmD [Helicobacter sp. MIT 05-5294]
MPKHHKENPKRDSTAKPLQSTLKVLGGIYKGRKLQMASLQTTRSSKAILKESFFNTLGFQLFGANFVEFFAGSGSIGIEALSRGAKSALFFERSSAACEILQMNLQTICQNDESYRVVLGDTFECYRTALKDLQVRSIAYLDPPFPREDSQIYPKCFQMVEDLDRDCFALVVIEHISSLEIPQNIGDFVLVKTRKFGRSSLSYFE